MIFNIFKRHYSIYSILLCSSRLLLTVLIFGYLFFNQKFLSPVFSDGPSVVINEIMYDSVQIDPCDDSNGEWVELKNADLSNSLTMNNWSVKDYTSTSRSFSGVILAGGYILLVSNKSCFLQNHPGVSESLIIDLNAKIGSGLNNSNGTTGFADQVWIFDELGTQATMVEYKDGASEGKSLALFGGSWEEANSTPGAENGSQSQPQQKDPGEELQPAVIFTATSNVIAGAEFAVTVNLSNFEAGTYHVKVLVGKGDSFIYGNTKNGSEWLTQNGAWVEMPSVSVGSSGLANKVVEAKVDDDAADGSYLIKVRVNKDSDNYDSAEKALAVKAAPVISESPIVAGTTGNSDKSENVDDAHAAASLSEEGQVLGESNPEDKKGFTLNFYLIVGIFGLVVGSGGIILAFRRVPK